MHRGAIKGSSGSSGDTHNRPRVKGLLPRGSIPWCPLFGRYSVIGMACRRRHPFAPYPERPLPDRALCVSRPWGPNQDSGASEPPAGPAPSPVPGNGPPTGRVARLLRFNARAPARLRRPRGSRRPATPRYDNPWRGCVPGQSTYPDNPLPPRKGFGGYAGCFVFPAPAGGATVFRRCRGRERTRRENQPARVLLLSWPGPITMGSGTGQGVN